MPEIGLKLWSVNTDTYLHEARRLHAEEVIAYIELFVVPGTLDTLDAWRRLQDETGMPFIIHNAHFAAGFNLADASMAENNSRIFSQTRAFAEALEARYVIFHGGMDGTIEETVRQLKALGEPRALLENAPCRPLPNRVGALCCRGATVAEIGHVLRETGCGFCLDVGHAVCSANSQGIEPYSFVTDLAARFAPVMFHLSDVADMTSPYDAHPHLGTGALDMARLCREVFPDGAAISIETVKDSPDNLCDFRRDAAWLRAVFNDHHGRRHV